MLSLMPLRLLKIHKTSQLCKCRYFFSFTSSLFIREETLPENRRYDWFSPAYQQRRPCVAEIACGECVTESVRLEPDSAVKQHFISCISITVHCGPCAHEHHSSPHCLLSQQTSSEVVLWCPCLLIYFTKVTVLVGEAERTEASDCRFRLAKSSTMLRIEIIRTLLTVAPPVNNLYRVLC